MNRNNFDWKQDYWIIYPDMLAIKEFKEFFEKEDNSSKIMWAIELALNPESRVYNDPDKLANLGKLILGDVSFKWEKYEGIMNAWSKYCLSPAQKGYDAILKLMAKRTKYLEAFRYEGAEPKEIDTVEKMVGVTFKLYQEFDRVAAILKDEKSKGKTNKPKSLLEKGLAITQPK